MFAPPLSLSPVDLTSSAQALTARMEAAAEALLRVRHEVVSALDHQVSEIQQLHRALASPPPPMVLVDDVSASRYPSPPAVGAPVLERSPLFEHAPDVVTATGPLTATKTMEPVKEPAAVCAVAALAPEAPLMETSLDPVLERATLEELNDALASAFAMVSARSSR